MTFQPEPTVSLFLDEAEVLKDTLGRLEDWLMHCDSFTSRTSPRSSTDPATDAWLSKG